ncbi:MAG: methyltransferase domain-containing protein [Novosphingobium sp.]|nr:methyltransferase domain-containing protein [Novosphingobium sp.]
MAQRRKISAAFSAAEEYSRHASVQRKVALDLADRIAALPLPRQPRILEIGCGTGFLTEAAIERGVRADWLVTDISPEMVERCREKLAHSAKCRFAVLDGEFGEPDGEKGFDLICSSLAFQWFDDVACAIDRIVGWLAPGGHLLFTTLVSGTFAEWQAAHVLAGLEPGTPRFSTVGQLSTVMPDMRQEPIVVMQHVEQHANALEFLRTMKAIGAHTASARHRPLGPASMRQVMRNFEKAGATATYEVATCHYRRLSGST